MTRFYNGRTLRMGTTAAVTGDEVWTDGGRLVYVGEKKAEMPAFEREIDLNGDLLMPGFKNAHAHTGMTFLRSYADDLPLQEWLFEKVFPMEAHLNPERSYWLTKLGILDYLAGGITSAFDMYYNRPAVAKACAESGYRMVICNGADGENLDLQKIRDEIAAVTAVSPLVTYILGYHAEYTIGAKALGQLSQLSHALHSPVFTHNSETKRETEGCLEKYGITPAALMEREGLLDYGGGGYHCTWFTREDMEIFRRHNAWAVTCPASNAKLASGIAPITEMLEAGVNLAIGTDGPASNNALDMFREMYLCCVLQKLQKQDAAACDAAEVLRMAASGGARAMGLSDCDDIAPGKRADLVVLDMHRPNMQPVLNPIKNIVYSGSRENVRMTMIDGVIRYENGKFFIGEDPERIYARCQEITDQMKTE